MTNVMRQTYRQLTDQEKLHMDEIKNLGQALYDHIESSGNSREISIAKTKVEEAVMWAVKHITSGERA